MKTTGVNKWCTTRVALVCLCSALRALSGEKVDIGRLENPKMEVEFLVPEASFRAAGNRWNPSTTPFPADIRASADKAREHLLKVRHLNGRLTLNSVAIRVRGRNEVKCWYMEFYFDLESPRESAIHYNFPVMMLLDGTIAEEHFVRGAAPDNPASGAEDPFAK